MIVEEKLGEAEIGDLVDQLAAARGVLYAARGWCGRRAAGETLNEDVGRLQIPVDDAVLPQDLNIVMIERPFMKTDEEI